MSVCCKTYTFVLQFLLYFTKIYSMRRSLLFSIIYIITLSPLCLFAQSSTNTIVKGVVIDSLTAEELPYVAVQVEGTNYGAVTNMKGEFEFTSNSSKSTVVVSSLGYAEKKIKIKPGQVNKLRVLLTSEAIQINEVTVRRGKEKYIKKNNPAIELIEKVIERKDRHRPISQDYYQCEHYEKTVISINNISEKSKDSWWGKKISFIFDYLDTSEVTGKPILAVSIREKTEDIYYRKEPLTTWKVVQGTRTVGIDDFINDDGMRQFINTVFAEVNIFDNDIKMLLTRFPSPLSSTLATTFYKYYIEDTVQVNDRECIHLSFAPYNPESYGFTGHLFIANDSTYSVQKARLNVPKVINLNYVENLVIQQEFAETPEGVYYVKRNDVTMEMGLYGSKGGVQVRRIDTYDKYQFNTPTPPEITKSSDREIFNGNVADRADEFWAEKRQVPLKEKEDAINALIDKLREVPVIGASIWFAEILISGYIETHEESDKSKFDFGPMNTTVSYNTVEGFRLRAGGMTTANLHPHLFLSGYTAYGLRDKEWKYNAQLTYSFNDRKYFVDEFPIHSISVMHEYDTRQPGADFMFTSKDNIFVSLKVRAQNYMTYDRKTQLSYIFERRSGFSLRAWAKNVIQDPAGDLHFRMKDPNGSIYNLKNINFNEIGLRLRYAPGEKFAQTKRDRYIIERDVPIFALEHKMGVKGPFGGMYDYHRTELSFQKRWWMSMFGYINSFAQVGKVWNTVPFTMLGTPNANTSITIQPESYNLLDAMEFLNDEWAQVQLEYHLNGLIMNRIPILKYLKLRELVGIKGYYGRLTERNDPEKNRDAILFPVTKDDKPITYPMDKGPYLEMNVGLENLLNVIRVDYVWRLNYKEHPNAMKHGVRVALYFRF